MRFNIHWRLPRPYKAARINHERLTPELEARRLEIQDGDVFEIVSGFYVPIVGTTLGEMLICIERGLRMQLKPHHRKFVEEWVEKHPLIAGGPAHPDKKRLLTLFERGKLCPMHLPYGHARFDGPLTRGSEGVWTCRCWN